MTATFAFKVRQPASRIVLCHIRLRHERLVRVPARHASSTSPAAAFDDGRGIFADQYFAGFTDDPEVGVFKRQTKVF